MNFQSSLRIASGATLALACTIAGAQTGSDLNRVEVTGQSLAPITRVDVHATCKDIDDELQRTLGALVERQNITGEMRVDFEVAGKEVVNVHSHGSTMDMRHSVNRAVGQISCVNGGQPQHYAFMLSMRQATDEELAAGSPAIVASIGSIVAK